MRTKKLFPIYTKSTPYKCGYLHAALYIVCI